MGVSEDVTFITAIEDVYLGCVWAYQRVLRSSRLCMGSSEDGTFITAIGDVHLGCIWAYQRTLRSSRQLEMSIWVVYGRIRGCYVPRVNHYYVWIYLRSIYLLCLYKLNVSPSLRILSVSPSCRWFCVYLFSPPIYSHMGWTPKRKLVILGCGDSARNKEEPVSTCIAPGSFMCTRCIAPFARDLGFMSHLKDF